MKLDWLSNDTIALLFLGAISICGVFVGMENVVIGAMSAIGGYIGSKVVNK